MSYFGIPLRNGVPIGLGSIAGFGVAPAFSPADLFSAGEQGAWYDPSDLSTLFTDSAGTTPVTAVEQFVGLMLDKRVPVAQTGYYSGVFDGNNDSLTLGTVSSFNFMHSPTALFTFECWVNVPSTASQLCIADNTSGTTAQTGFFVRILAGGAISLAITNSNGISPSVAGGSSTSTISANTWTHIAITYDQSLASANAKFYINGVAAGTLDKTAATPSSGDASRILLVGRFNGGGGEFNGFISNLRITNSIVYTGAFTPPTTPLTAVTNTQLLTCQNSTFIDNSPNNFAITANGGIVAGARNPFGNHATSTGTKRPKLAARYNLLTYTEQFDNGVWSKFAMNVTANAGVAPNGTTTADKLVPTAATAQHTIYNNPAITIANGTQYAGSVYAKADGYNFIAVATNIGGSGYPHSVCVNLITGATSNTGAGGTYTVTDAGNGWWRITASGTSASTAGYLELWPASSAISAGATTTGNGTDGVLVWGADLRPASQATGLIGPTYQRVVDAATYDTAGFLPYLQFDGIDDSMSTGSIDFTATDKMTVWAGVRKLSAASAQWICELSANVDVNNGAFLVDVENSGFEYIVGSRGTIYREALLNNAAYNAPITNVLTGIADISGDLVVMRLNGTQVVSNTTDQGTGNYGNYPLFIGARNNASLYFNGWLTSLIVRGAQSTQSQIEATESWVNGKTGAY